MKQKLEKPELPSFKLRYGILALTCFSLVKFKSFDLFK